MRRIALRRKTSQHCTLRNGDPSSDIKSLSRKHTLKDTEDRPRVVAVKKTDEAEGMAFLLYLPSFFFLPILSPYLSRTPSHRWLGQAPNLDRYTRSVGSSEENSYDQTTTYDYSKFS